MEHGTYHGQGTHHPEQGREEGIFKRGYDRCRDVATSRCIPPQKATATPWVKALAGSQTTARGWHLSGDGVLDGTTAQEISPQHRPFRHNSRHQCLWYSIIYKAESKLQRRVVHGAFNCMLGRVRDGALWPETPSKGAPLIGHWKPLMIARRQPKPPDFRKKNVAFGISTVESDGVMPGNW
jgi:hypothetical protein